MINLRHVYNLLQATTFIVETFEQVRILNDPLIKL